ncbi:MAG: D-glycero-beta-D-manno-heptose-7-phosphate kinase [Candidatus Neomarinimicrobiota bacterium]
MFKEIIKKIQDQPPKLLVIGDLMLDKFIFGSVNRISPEAPVPIVKYQKEKHMLGGCGNVIRNLRNLSVETSLVSVVGQDQAGDLIIDLLLEKDVSVFNILRERNIQTTEKMRIVADRQQILRVDWDMDDLVIEYENSLTKNISKEIQDIDGVVISDYGKGVCLNSIIKNVVEISKKNKIPVYVDPKGNDWEKYSYVNLITPNTKESEIILGRSLHTDTDFELAGEDICSMFNIAACLITRGSDGMSFISDRNTFHLKSKAKEIFDVSGAGDTVISAMATGLAIGLTSNLAAEFSNQAAGIVVGHIGTTAITIKELLNLN